MAGKEVCSISPNNPTNTATLKLKPSRNMSCSFRTQTHLAVRGYTATHLHVFEADISIPKFSSFSLLDSGYGWYS